MNCNDVQLMLSAFIDGELEPEHDASMFRHAGTCEECQRFFRSMIVVRQSIVGSVLHEPNDEPDTQIRRPLASIQSWQNMRTFGRIAMPVSVAASVAAILIIVSFVLSPVLFPLHTASAEQTSAVIPSDLPLEAQMRLAGFLR